MTALIRIAREGKGVKFKTAFGQGHIGKIPREKEDCNMSVRTVREDKSRWGCEGNTRNNGRQRFWMWIEYAKSYLSQWISVKMKRAQGYFDRGPSSQIEKVHFTWICQNPGEGEGEALRQMFCGGSMGAVRKRRNLKRIAITRAETSKRGPTIPNEKMMDVNLVSGNPAHTRDSGTPAGRGPLAWKFECGFGGSKGIALLS